MTEHKNVDDVIAEMVEARARSMAKKTGDGRINSGVKGDNWERKVAKALRDRFAGQQFSKTSGSGARGTIGGLTPEATRVMTSDMIVPDDFRFSLEMKSGYSDIMLFDFFCNGADKPFGGGRRSPVKKFVGFVGEAYRDAKRVGREWMVIWKPNRQRPMCAVQLPPSEVGEYDANFSFVIERDRWHGAECLQHLPEKMTIWFYTLNDLLQLPDDFWYVPKQ